ncbi:MAG: hypothetical protein RBG13Loki_1891 [Promethearchaeota archaeon CR_4]|nr:MAG: hypothetical protein RBG13Loki_1891 [Candidatus Lokiarchaeota archaeon CR_4]
MQVIPSRKIYEVFFSEDFDPWRCCSCSLCEIACPEHFSPRNEIFAKRHDIVHKGGPVPKQIQSYLGTLEQMGFIFPMDDWTNEMREDLNLPNIDFNRIARKFQKFVVQLKLGLESPKNKETCSYSKGDEGNEKNVGRSS